MMGKFLLESFRPVTFTTQRSIEAAGLSRRRHLIVTTDVEVERPDAFGTSVKATETFVRICTREPWIRDAILFKSERIRGDRSIDVSLIAKLRSKCNERHFSDLDVEVPDSPDPMDEMNVTNVSGEKPGRKRRKTKADHYVFRPHIHRVKMPVSPPGALDSVVERDIRVYAGEYTQTLNIFLPSK